MKAENVINFEFFLFLNKKCECLTKYESRIRYWLMLWKDWYMLLVERHVVWRSYESSDSPLLSACRDGTGVQQWERYPTERQTAGRDHRSDSVMNFWDNICLFMDWILFWKDVFPFERHTKRYAVLSVAKSQ